MSLGMFAELGLPSDLVEVLDRKLITEPFDIQAMAIPDALGGRDILGRAPTGSGKTLAFGLPMLARLDVGTRKRPRGLILSPTRELAEQICRELEPLARAVDRSILAVYGGTGLDRQIKALRKGVDVVVACPGRLLDLINQKAVELDDVDIVVVDEADRMADMGFLPDVRTLLDQTSPSKQMLLFSATLDRDVQVLIDTYQHDPVVHEVGEPEPDLSTMRHRFIKVAKTERIWLSADIIDDAGPTVVFCRTRHGVDRLARQLKKEGIRAGYIHGGRSQSQRDRALRVFIDGKVDALVATDVAARGIHVDGVACVIHYDPPAEIKDYVHRSGRTARAGAAGVVVSFIDGPQVKESEKMQRKLGLDAEIEPAPPRRPRSSRPAVVEDLRAEAPPGRSRRSGSGRNGNSSDPADRPRRRSKPHTGQGPSGGRSSAARVAGKPGARQSGPGKSGAGDTTKPGPGQSTPGKTGADNGKPGARQAGAGNGRPGARQSGQGKSGAGDNTKPGARQSGPGKAGASKAGTAKRANGSGSDPKRSPTARPGTGRKPTGKKRSPATGSGKTGGAIGAKTKRSGRARPKNRKNKPKAGGRS